MRSPLTLTSIFFVLSLLQPVAAHALAQTITVTVDDSAAPIKIEPDDIWLRSDHGDEVKFCVENKTAKTLTRVTLDHFYEKRSKVFVNPLATGLEPEVGAVGSGAKVCSQSHLGSPDNHGDFDYLVHATFSDGPTIKFAPTLHMVNGCVNCLVIFMQNATFQVCDPKTCSY